MILDDQTSLEAYPIFDDLANATTAPRLIDLRRVAPVMLGEVRRRYMRGAIACEAKSQIRVTSCADDRLEVVLADPMAPVSFAPCAWAGTAPSHREIWTRE